MKRLNTQTHIVYETTAGVPGGPKRNFLIFINEQQLKTYIYMNMDEDGAYYMEDRLWSDGKTIEEKAQHAKDYIERYIDIMEETADNLAVGANAVSKRVWTERGLITRFASQKDLPTYIAHVDEIIQKKREFFQ